MLTFMKVLSVEVRKEYGALLHMVSDMKTNKSVVYIC